MSENENNENKKESQFKSILIVLAGVEIIEKVITIIDRIKLWFD